MMEKILIVQRQLTHYRKLLLHYLCSEGNYSIDVFCMGKKYGQLGNVTIFPNKEVKVKFGKREYTLGYSKKLLEAIKQRYKEYDYIILEGATNIVNNIPICAFLKSKNMGYIIWDAGRRKNAHMSFFRKLAQCKLDNIWRNADAIMAYSTLAKQYFESIGIESNRIFVCQNTLNVGEFDNQIKGIDTSELAELRSQYATIKEKIILYVGAVQARKRIVDLINSFQKLQTKRTDIKLLIIGGGDELEKLKTYVINNKIENVKFLGPIIDGVIKYFKIADVFALPSEGGLSLNQAMICSKTIIASSADGTEIDLIQDGNNGFLFQEGNVSELAEKIDLALKDDQTIQSMGKHSREIIDTRVNEANFLVNFKKCLSFSRR
jgi:glycosyltransferase involved in cell wall biosynthesis